MVLLATLDVIGTLECEDEDRLMAKREIPRIDELAGYVSTERARTLLGGVSEARVRQLVMDGALNAGRWAGHSLMIRESSIQKYLRRHPVPENRPGPKAKPSSSDTASDTSDD